MTVAWGQWCHRCLPPEPVLVLESELAPEPAPGVPPRTLASEVPTPAHSVWARGQQGLQESPVAIAGRPADRVAAAGLGPCRVEAPLRRGSQVADRGLEERRVVARGQANPAAAEEERAGP